ncbi:kallikrein-1 [Ornithorhynchus anatinus]|uniref:Kallikrein 1 n=1 Tax=Ornithorhynchus anatinus TaxID=9258 RepID=A0A6I8NN48_ORNAN|nr:kallikrein-1 [Ornithorhynchus anatinus]
MAPSHLPHLTMWFSFLTWTLLLGSTGVTVAQVRILGGQECPPNSHPWQVALYYFSDFVCGGVLIDSNWVLTAAHCQVQHYQVWLGRRLRWRTTRRGGVSSSWSKASFPHPDFNMSLVGQQENPEELDYSHDIMLLQLAEPAQFNSYIQPLTLPKAVVSTDTTCWTSGWGSISSNSAIFPSELQCVELQILPNEICDLAHPEKVTEFMLCAGLMQGGKDSCQGDSGGPLICNNTLQGITSWGHFPCGLPGKPGLSTKVFAYLDWIAKTMEDN